MFGRSVAAVVLSLAVLGSAGSATAQEYTWETISSAGVKVRVHKKLQGVPVTLGQGGNILELHRAARFDPRANQSIMKGSQPFKWGMDVYLFTAPPKYTDKPTDQDEIRRRAVEEREWSAKARNYHDFRTNKDPTSAQAEYHGRAGKDGQDIKARGPTPAHTLYEYSSADSIKDTGLAFRWYNVAAHYQLEGREVACVFTWPIFKDKPDSKYLGIAKKMVESLQVVESAAGGEIADDDPRTEHANTDERRRRLDAATANIRGIDGWDFFTSPAGIVLYSWKPGNQSKQKKALKAAEDLAEHLEALPALFAEQFPAYEEMPEFYPVLRICFDRATFRNYGRPPLRAEGFFESKSQEIVIMEGGDREPEHLVGRYGFEAFASTYFNTSNLGAWFAYGFGEFYAGQKHSGGRWKFEPNDLWIKGPKGADKLFGDSQQASLGEVTRWKDDKLAPDQDNDDAEKWISQTYALADFLVRGSKLGPKWNEAWAQILPAYTAELRKTRNAGRAAKAAFDGIDSAAFEAAWKDWVDSQISRK